MAQQGAKWGEAQEIPNESFLFFYSPCVIRSLAGTSFYNDHLLKTR